jgi:hypothetical protein
VLANKTFPPNKEQSMRVTAFLPLLLLSAVAQANELHVGTGQEYLIEQPDLRLTRLVLEDGAVLKVRSDIGTLRLSAEQAWIGKDVRILAKGADGAPAGDAAPAPAPAACEEVSAGATGLAGGTGGDGVNLELALGLHRFGSLLLDARGGAGGAGGAGGDGADGASDPRCAGGNGGAGGDGGSGGTGGRGGNVELRYWSVSETGHVPVSNYGPGVQILTEGGVGAASGKAGAGGAGGRGEKIKRPTGIIVYRTSGVDGKPGAVGGWGAHGASGTFLIQPQSAPGR